MRREGGNSFPVILSLGLLWMCRAGDFANGSRRQHPNPHRPANISHHSESAVHWCARGHNGARQHSAKRNLLVGIRDARRLIRLALGFAVCLWIVIHMFMLPRTAEGYRTWVYLGLVIAPLAWVVAIIIWR
jgi:hypothetical protein